MKKFILSFIVIIGLLGFRVEAQGAEAITRVPASRSAEWTLKHAAIRHGIKHVNAWMEKEVQQFPLIREGISRPGDAIGVEWNADNRLASFELGRLKKGIITAKHQSAKAPVARYIGVVQTAPTIIKTPAAAVTTNTKNVVTPATPAKIAPVASTPVTKDAKKVTPVADHSRMLKELRTVSGTIARSLICLALVVLALFLGKLTYDNSERIRLWFRSFEGVRLPVSWKKPHWLSRKGARKARDSLLAKWESLRERTPQLHAKWWKETFAATKSWFLGRTAVAWCVKKWRQRLSWRYYLKQIGRFLYWGIFYFGVIVRSPFIGLYRLGRWVKRSCAKYKKPGKLWIVSCLLSLEMSYQQWMTSFREWRKARHEAKEARARVKIIEPVVSVVEEPVVEVEEVITEKPKAKPSKAFYKAWLISLRRSWQTSQRKHRADDLAKMQAREAAEKTDDELRQQKEKERLRQAGPKIVDSIEATKPKIIGGLEKKVVRSPSFVGNAAEKRRLEVVARYEKEGKPVPGCFLAGAT